jgi:hypothetical protein
MSRERCKAVKSPDYPTRRFAAFFVFLAIAESPELGKTAASQVKDAALNGYIGGVRLGQGRVFPRRDQSAIFGIAFIADHYNHVFHV